MNSQAKSAFAHILLAAGASTRMGRPKQLLPWNGKPLIRHAIEQIRDAGFSNRLIVVLGAHADQIRPELEQSSVEIVHNPDWENGMGSSLRCGLEYLLHEDANAYNGIGISLVDQPLITARDLRQMYEQWLLKHKPIAAAQYNDTLGVPAIFDRKLFPQLLALDGQAGARRILMQHQADVLPYPLPAARFDLDTPEDYRELRTDD